MKRNRFLEHAGVELPIICGAMYPCSNPELVAAASEAGGLGIIQPISLVFAHKYSFEEGLAYIQSLTSKPVGMNVIVENSTAVFQDRARTWLRIALESGIRFFVTSLGKPDWVVEEVKRYNGVVYHDVTRRLHAEKAIAAGVDGLICVNNRAGGHTGIKSQEALYRELADFGIPLISAGGIATPEQVKQTLKIGFEGCQLGTRFIASKECSAHENYKRQIVRASEKDIVLTEKISGVPVSVIETDYVRKIGTRADFLSRMLLQNDATKHFARMVLSAKSVFDLKAANSKGTYDNYFLAGKSVEGIHHIASVSEIMNEFRNALNTFSDSQQKTADKHHMA